jgi:hypothetical protein
LEHDWTGPHSMIVAGPEALSYRDFMGAIAMASGVATPRIVSVPAGPLLALAPLTRVIPGLPNIAAAEIRRLLEDKAFDIGPMRAVLGVTPISLAEGLALTFGSNHAI